MIDFTTRITILTSEEIDNLYGIPKFSDDEKSLYCTPDPVEWDIVNTHRSLESKLLFILQLGYFKARKLFFILVENDIRRDIRFIKNTCFPNESLPKTLKINKITCWNQQKRILTLYNYHECNALWRVKIEEKARETVKISSKPIYIFKGLLVFLDKYRVMLPAYSTMQDIVSKAIAEERERLSALAKKHVTDDVDQILQKFLNREDSSFLLTVLKKEPKDFTHKQISQEIAKQKMLAPLYKFAMNFLPLLDISNDNIKYYASLVDFYSVFRIKRLRSEIVHVYLFCFIYHRYQRISDNLVNTFIFYVRKYADSAKFAAKLRIYEANMGGNHDFGKVGKVLGFYLDDQIPDETAFIEVRKRAFKIMDKEKFQSVVRYISNIRFDEKEFQWKELEKLSPAFKKNLRPVFMALDFKSTSKKDSLMDATDFLKTNIDKKISLTTIKTDCYPQRFISRKLKRYIIEKKKIKIQGSSRILTEIRNNRYEFLVYSLLKECLESGDIFIQDSIRFQSFESDLIDDERWKNKDQLIHDMGLSFLSKPIDETLAELKEELETLFIEVNRRIREGENKNIKITGTGKNVKWTLPYKKPEDITNHPLFEHLAQIEIRDLLAFVDTQCGFMKAFTHILDRYVKSDAEDDDIVGSITALGTNKGVFKMAQSSDLTYQSLFSAMKNYLRLETLRNANDKISNALSKLPIFKYFNIEDDIIHSSSDGQKFETQINTINARYSPKYFGLKKGVTSYTMLANNVPVNAKIIGTNEHESHFVFDIVYNNTSEIQSNRHSVDSHGTNKVNFLILHAFDYELAPRYRDINSKTETLYGFKDLKHYEGFLLKPSRKVNEKRIITEWPNAQRIFVSLGLKTTTQSVIIGKLSSYPRKNRTKRALWELDNIYRTIYILKYVDDLILRQNVQRALNRGEAYHQLRRAISYEHSGKLRVDTEEEQQIWSECSRLLSNAIIFYNSYLLSKLLMQMEEKKKPNLVERIQKVSPIAWRHVNLGGRFEFTKQKRIPNIEEMVSKWLNLLENYS